MTPTMTPPTTSLFDHPAARTRSQRAHPAASRHPRRRRAAAVGRPFPHVAGMGPIRHAVAEWALSSGLPLDLLCLDAILSVRIERALDRDADASVLRLWSVDIVDELVVEEVAELWEDCHVPIQRLDDTRLTETIETYVRYLSAHGGLHPRSDPPGAIFRRLHALRTSEHPAPTAGRLAAEERATRPSGRSRR